MKEAVIRSEGATYHYKSDEGEPKGVENVTLEIHEGDFVVLLGHNGSGKSTLAKLFNGFLVPDEGKITVAGLDTADEKLCYEIRSKVGMVFQNPDNQTVASIIEDDVAFGPENLGVPPDEIRRRVDWALKAVNMYEYRERTPHKLSGGQKQRIAIAAILAMLPSVLILDESTAMLDPEGRKEVLETVKKLNKERNITVILITHYMDEALDADKIFVLSNGKIISSGTPYEIFSDEKTIKEAKLELPVATAVSAELKNAGFDVGTALTDEELAEEICRLI
ncbi:MAG: energy-coupling factor transporter ATPase [Christensenellales bacterium]